MRDLATLPKAHLHLHFTGSMRPETLLEVANERGVRLPAVFTDGVVFRGDPSERGWFRFQRQYDAARAVVRDEGTMRRMVREAAADDAAEGSGRLELQIDPTTYGAFVGGITPALEIVLDEAKSASAHSGTEVAIIVAASRIRHPLEARTLARLAARYAGDGPGEVVGFGLSNDERRGDTSEFAPAFKIAARAGLALVPHGGELLGPSHLREVIDQLNPDRIGHGVRAADHPAMLARIAADRLPLEICPTSNIALGVVDAPADVPLRLLYDSGVTVALGADDPLLFGSRLVDQYQLAREHLGFTDEELADLAAMSVNASTASEATKRRLLGGIDTWLATAPSPDSAEYPVARRD